MGFQFLSGIGRVVQGSALVPSTTDQDGQPLVYKTGKNVGQPRTNFFIAVAFAKMVAEIGANNQPTGNMIPNPDFAELSGKMAQEARTGYPACFNAQGQCTHPRFAWKFADGDGVDANGKPNSEKTGFAGHWVVKFSSNFAPKVVYNGNYTNDERAIKCGDYVRIAGDCQPNIGSNVPGLYLNHSAIEFIAYGEEIRTGIDAIGVFGAAPAGNLALPPGASLTPMGGAAPQMPAMGMPPQPMAAPQMAAPQMPAMGMPPQPMAAPQMPAMGMPPQPMAAPQMPAMGMPPQPMAAPQMPAMGMPPQPMAAPNHAFVNNAAGYPQPPAQQALPPAAPVYTATPAAQGFTLEQWTAQGHTVDQLVAAGMFIRS